MFKTDNNIMGMDIRTAQVVSEMYFGKNYLRLQPQTTHMMDKVDKKNIQGLKSDKTRIYNNEIKPAKESIGRIKEDQKRLRRLRTKGETKTSLDQKVTSQSARISESEDRVSQAQEQVERQDQAIDNEIQLIMNEIRDLWAEYKEKNK